MPELDDIAALLATGRGALAQALAWECPVRRSWLVHLAGGCSHWRDPHGGRVGCYCAGREPPEGWARTAAQQALDDAEGTP